MESQEPWLEYWKWAGALAGPRSNAALPGFEEAARSYLRFAEDFSRLAERGLAGGAAPDATAMAQELEATARRFFAQALPASSAAAPPGTRLTQAAATWSAVLSEV